MGKHAKRMLEIGQVMDKLNCHGFTLAQYCSSFVLRAKWDHKNILNVCFNTDKVEIWKNKNPNVIMLYKYIDPFWQDQLLAKVDELIGESK